MEILLLFFLWMGLVFLMMRMGCDTQQSGPGANPFGAVRGHGSTNLRWIAPDKDIDPVCKKTVATATAKSSVHDGRVYYFCSRDCREIFEVAPDLYVGFTTPETMERIHV